MKEEVWKAKFDPVFRNAIIALFLSQGVDFEKEMIEKSDITKPAGKEITPWMTRAEAAEYARVSTDTIDNWCVAGYIRRAKLGVGKPGCVSIDRESLEKFMRSRVDNRPKRVRKMAPSVPGGYHVSSGK